MQRHLRDLLLNSSAIVRCKRQSDELVACVQSKSFPWIILTFDVLSETPRLVAAMSGTPNGAIDKAFLARVADAVRATRGHCP